MKRYILYVAIFMVVSGCASQPRFSSHEAMALLAKDSIADQSSPLVIEVPASGNFLSNKLIIASLSGGVDSSSSKTIRSILNSGKGVAVFTESMDVMCATLSRSLDDIEKAVRDGLVIKVLGEGRVCPSVAEEAAWKGFDFEIVSSQK
jgi:hypothetical protein